MHRTTGRMAGAGFWVTGGLPWDQSGGGDYLMRRRRGSLADTPKNRHRTRLYPRSTPQARSRPMSEADVLIALFARHGGDGYFGEKVTQAEHALQSAALAEAEQASPALIVAALLHDVGHLIHTGGEDIAERGIDARHEAIGATYLARHFGPAVVEPVRLHVPAKRYLCAIDKTYWQDLSPASKRSLELQGGAFTPDEAEA